MDPKKEMLSIEKQIEKIKGKIVALGPLRPGSLSEQYNVCGRPDCRCKDNPPKKHGPYHQLSFTLSGKSSSSFVKKEHLPAVKRQVANHQKLKQLVKQWVELGARLSALQIQIADE